MTRALGWLALGMSLACIVFAVRRYRLGAAAATGKWDTTIIAVLGGCIAAVILLAWYDSRVVGYAEWNYQFYLRPAWGSVMMLLATGAAIAGSMSRRGKRAPGLLKLLSMTSLVLLGLSAISLVLGVREHW